MANFDVFPNFCTVYKIFGHWCCSFQKSYQPSHVLFWSHAHPPVILSWWPFFTWSTFPFLSKWPPDRSAIPKVAYCICKATGWPRGSVQWAWSPQSRYRSDVSFVRPPPNPHRLTGLFPLSQVLASWCLWCPKDLMLINLPGSLSDNVYHPEW